MSESKTQSARTNGPTSADKEARLEVAARRTDTAYGGAGEYPASSTYARQDGDPVKSSYSSYLFGASGTEDRPAWSDSTQGRAAIRLISRGIVGAAAFTLGGIVVRKHMEGYESFIPLSELKPLKNGKPLQYAARFFDATAGKAIENITYLATPGTHLERATAAWNSTNFRSKIYKQAAGAPTTQLYRGTQQYLNGRGLGEEIATITFDFFSASLGDAATRNIIQAIDPNVQQPWWVDENGRPTTRDKGKFNAGKWLESVGRASWRVLSKNGGEDWAAALPYVYQMKWQRQTLAKRFGGFKLSADHSWNGGLATVATRDMPEVNLRAGQIVDGYQKPGLLDLQFRFMGYNWYTLMYREAYDTVASKFQKWQENGFKLEAPKIDNPVAALANSVGFGARYATKSFLKSGLYMTPAVIPFWLFRTPQSKWKGAYADHDLARMAEPTRESALLTKTPMALAQGGANHDPIFLQDIASDVFPRAQLIHGAKRPDKVFFGNGNVLKATPGAGKTIFDIKHPYEFTGIRRTPFEHVLNVFGATSFHGGTGVTKMVDWITQGKPGAITKWIHGAGVANASAKDLLLTREKALRNGMDAALSYTPYMWLKGETALRVDDRRSIDELGHMDKALYRLIDSSFSFKFADAGKALKDIGHLALNFEREPPSREGGLKKADIPTPSTTVEAGTIKRPDMVALARSDNDNEHSANENDPHTWAEQVAGRRVDAQYHPARATLH